LRGEKDGKGGKAFGLNLYQKVGRFFRGRPGNTVLKRGGASVEEVFHKRGRLIITWENINSGGGRGGMEGGGIKTETEKEFSGQPLVGAEWESQKRIRPGQKS